MKINREELLSALNNLSPGLANKKILEQSTSFIFQAGIISSYNDEILVQIPMEHDISGAIQAKPLLSILSKLKSTEVEIFMDEEGFIVKGPRSKTSIKMESEICLPIDEVRVPDTWKRVPDEFLAAVSVCLFSVSSDMSHPELTCLHVGQDFIESSDGQRITRATFKSKLSSSFLFPADCAAHLKKYSPSHYSVAEGWVHFKNESTGIVFSSRTMEGKFPNTSPFLSVEGQSVKFPEDMMEVLDRAGIFSNSEFADCDFIEIKISEKKISVLSEGDEGKHEEQFRIKSDAECSFLVNPGFLKEILPHLTEVLVGETLLLFEGDNFKHSLCLVSR